MEVLRHSCILLCHHAILPEGYTKGTILMSKPQRDITSFHEQAEKLGEIGSEVTVILVLRPSLSAKRADWTWEREYASSGKGLIAYSPLVQCYSSGEIWFRGLSLSHTFFLSSWTGKATFCPILGTTSKDSILPYSLKCVKEFKSTNFVTGTNTHYFLLSITSLCNN